MSTDYLPGDVLSDIMARLKAEDLVRCTAVCKKWYVLIRSPNFISLHLKQSLEDKDRNYLLVGIRKSTEDFYLCAEGTWHEPKKFTVPLYSLFKLHFRIVGSCNGLVCLFSGLGLSRHEMMLIWNPLIKKAINVPIPEVSFDRFASCVVGFGFDSVTNDIKIVKITYPPLCSSEPPLVQVYSLNKGVWRFVKGDRSCTDKVYKGFQQAYVREAAHWLAESTCKRHILILAFDMKDDMFREILVPESVRFRRICGHEMSLHVYQESISLFHHYFCYDTGPCCEILVMREYGVQESWARQLKIDLQAPVLGRAVFGMAIGTRSNGEFLFASKEGELLSYDHEKILVSDLKVKGIKAFFASYVYAGAYTESLLLLDKGEDLYDIASRVELAKTRGGK